MARAEEARILAARRTLSSSSSSVRSRSSDAKVSANEKQWSRPADGSDATANAPPRDGRQPADRVVAQGPEAEALAQQYAQTIARHSRLHPDNKPSKSARAALLLFIVVLFWYAIQGRLRLIAWKRTFKSEQWDRDYTDWEHMMPMAEDVVRPAQHVEL